MILDLVYYGDPLLRRESKSVSNIDESIVSLSNDMIETMYSKGGIGLAAPQIGKSLRVIVVDVSDDMSNPIVFINPEIIESLAEHEYEDREGCLSFPGIYCYVTRHSIIKVKYTNLLGEEKFMLAKDLLARCIQHEIDHIDGKVFIDRLSLTDRNQISGALKKLSRQTKKKK